MDKNEFRHVLDNFTESTVEEAQEILSLKQKYPYSQLLHALAARASKDHGFSNQQAELQVAAIYSSDRSVLKEILTTDFGTPLSQSSGNVTDQKETSPLVNSLSYKNTFSDDVAEEVIHDLERLSELKHNFELLFTDLASHPKSEPKKVITEEKISAPEETIDPLEKLSISLKKKKGLSRKERIIALAKATDELAEASSHTLPEEATDKKKEKTGESLIDEIISTKKEIDPETEKQKEQIEIIDQFIKAQPSITSAKEKPIPAPVGDLSTIKSGEFGDNIVSETLVDILLKQGKKDKAIEVLKKLIWKFPQKKAYFATLIEDLKK